MRFGLFQAVVPGNDIMQQCAILNMSTRFYQLCDLSEQDILQIFNCPNNLIHESCEKWIHIFTHHSWTISTLVSEVWLHVNTSYFFYLNSCFDTDSFIIKCYKNFQSLFTRFLSSRHAIQFASQKFQVVRCKLPIRHVDTFRCRLTALSFEICQRINLKSWVACWLFEVFSFE